MSEILTLGGIDLPNELQVGKGRVLLGEVQIKAAASDDKMQMSGYVSTKDPDLGNDIVDPESFRKHLYRYENNPVYCWQHDQNTPIGKVLNVSIDSKGLYLDNITLSNIDFVKNFIWILVKDGVLKQQSIGFLALDGKQRGKFFEITESYLLESSLVTVAMNPEAVIDTVRGKMFDDDGQFRFKDVQSIMRAYYSGEIDLRHEVEKKIAFGDKPWATDGEDTEVNNLSNTNSHPLTPDFADAKAIPMTDDMAQKYDPEGEPIDLPKAWDQKAFEEVAPFVYLAKSEVRGSYMFEVNYPTEKGFGIHWDRTAMAMGKLLGAKGGSHFVPEQKLAMLERLAANYKLLGKKTPTIGETVSIFSIKPEMLAEVKFHEITFHEGEKELLELALFENNVKSIKQTLERYSGKNAEDFPEGIRMQLKDMFAVLEVYAYVFDEDDAAEAQALLQVVSDAMQTDTTPDEGAYASDKGANVAAIDPVKEEAKKRLLEALRDFKAVAE